MMNSSLKNYIWLQTRTLFHKNKIFPLTPPSRLSPVRLSPDFQDLSKRVRLSPAFFAYHFQDLTEQDLTEQDLIKLDLMI